MGPLKILTKPEFQDLSRAGTFAGSPDDARDGFIHLCTQEQLPDTLRVHFEGKGEVVVLELDPERLSPHLVFEPSRGGALFPHLYRPLEWTDVRRVLDGRGEPQEEPPGSVDPSPTER